MRIQPDQSGQDTFAGITVSSDTADMIMRSYPAADFREGVVSDDVIRGYSAERSTSARRNQCASAAFYRVRNREPASGPAARYNVEGAAVVVVSGKPDERTGINIAFDCAPAAQNMYLAAQSLGLGAHLYYSGAEDLNKTMKDAIGIPRRLWSAEHHAHRISG